MGTTGIGIELADPFSDDAGACSAELLLVEGSSGSSGVSLFEGNGATAGNTAGVEALADTLEGGEGGATSAAGDGSADTGA